MATKYGYTNTVYYVQNPHAPPTTWFPSRARRDEALRAFRRRCVVDGLSDGSARAGIYPVKRTVTQREFEREFHGFSPVEGECSWCGETATYRDLDGDPACHYHHTCSESTASNSADFNPGRE